MRRSSKRSAGSVTNGERGTIYKEAPCRVALGYPAPYGVGVSSLGFQHVYRMLNDVPGLACERFFLAGEVPRPRPLVTVERRRPVGGMGAVLFSVACERELAGLVALLEAAELSPLARDRGPKAPPVIIGGPLTYVDPALVAPLADIVAVGEADSAIPPLGEILTEFPESKAALMAEVSSRCPDLWIPGFDPRPAANRSCRGGTTNAPAVAATWSPNAELKDLFLVEASRGCPRRCGFCTMSRKTDRSPRYRVFPLERILSTVPRDAGAVGLVGAAVSEHPEIVRLVSLLVDAGKRVSLSSLRADHLSRELAVQLKRGGLRTMTIAADGASEAMRQAIDKGIHQHHLEDAAAIARDAGFKRLRVYAMVGLPGEEDADIAEFAGLLRSLSGGLDITASVQAFVPKPGTPLGHAGMADIRLIDHRLKLLGRHLKGKARIQPTSPRWSWVDFKLAHAKARAALIAVDANRDGGSFAAWKRAIAASETP